MPIIAPQPFVVPPAAEETFTQQWIWNLQINTPQINEGVIAISLLPFDPARDVLGDGRLMEIIQTDKLWLAIAEVPEVAVAMKAMLDAVGPLRAWIAARETPLTPEPESETVVPSA